MSRQFWLIAQDGQSYGPADERVLAQWAREGRLTSLSTLQDAATNQRLQASQVPSLAAIFGPGSPATFQQQQGFQQAQGLQQPGQRSVPYQQQSAYQQQQTAMPVGMAYGMPNVGYQQPIAQQPATYPHPAAYQQQQVGYANPYAGVSTAHGLTSFNPVAAILLHWVTFGLFSLVYHQLKHDKLPLIRPDDPSGGKAVGFMFIPFFNLWYWNFFANLRLCDRINEQRRLAGLPETAPRGLALGYAICMAIPYVNALIGFLIMGPIYFGVLQANVNELVRATRGPNA